MPRGNTDTGPRRSSRKRETDRLAQQQHRLRQKERVERLEAQLRAREEEVTFLAQQNMLLKRNNPDRESWGTEGPSEQAALVVDAPETSEAQQHTGTLISAPTSPLDEFLSEPYNQAGTSIPLATLTQLNDYLLHTAASEPELPNSLFCEYTQSTPSHCPMLLHRCTPYRQFPRTPSEFSFMRILRQASESMEITRQPLPRPAVVNPLSRSDSDPISDSLTSFLQQLQDFQRLPEFFCSHWTIYLLIRWLVNQDQESFEDLPTWLQPTRKQLDISHSVIIDTIPWPSIRDELIKISEESPAAIPQILDHLASNVAVCIDSSSGYSNIEQQIYRLQSWTLGERFFQDYPSWYDLYNADISIYIA